MLTKGVCLAHNNARPHMTNATKTLLDSFDWDLLNHSAYSSDLAPSDFHLFVSLKTHMVGKKFSTDEEVKQEVLNWKREMTGEFFEEDVKKLVPRLATCIEREGDYVNKYLTYILTKPYNFFLKIEKSNTVTLWTCLVVYRRSLHEQCCQFKRLLPRDFNYIVSDVHWRYNGENVQATAIRSQCPYIY